MKFLNVIKKIFSTPVPEQPAPKKGQVWAMLDDVVDRYCTPIVATVTDVVGDVVYYSTNYRKGSQSTVSKFKDSFTYQSN
jgi:hypothetical protein